MSEQLTEDEIETFASRPREIGARYCGDCAGLLADASGHVLNEHVQGCKGDDWPVVSQWFLFTSGATPPPPDDVAEQIKELREFLGDLPYVTDYETGIAIVEQLAAALESLSRERAVLVEGFKAAVRMSDTVQEIVFGECRPGWTDTVSGSAVMTYAAQDKLDTEAIRAALVPIGEGEKEKGDETTLR
jgi:hypothetical protein